MALILKISTSKKSREFKSHSARIPPSFMLHSRIIVNGNMSLYIHETFMRHSWDIHERGVIYKRGNISLIGKITFCGDAVQSSSLWFYPYSLPLHLLYIRIHVATWMLWPSINANAHTRLTWMIHSCMRMWGKSR